MKKIVLTTLMLMMAALSGNAMAEWVRVNSNDNLTAYADSSTLRKRINIVKILSLFDFKTENLLTDGSTYMSIVRETEFNCAENLQRMVSYSIYSGRMGKGKLLDSGVTPQDWKPVSKVSIALDMKKFACSREDKG